MENYSSHVVILPFPAQGHVIPLMELSHCLVERGFKITFVNTDFNHERILRALSKKGDLPRGINMVSIPDGLGPDEDRNDLGRLTEGFTAVMPGQLEKLIRAINDAEGESSKIKWMVADVTMGWSFTVAKKMGLGAVSFWPPSAALLAILLRIPKFIEDGALDERGLPKRKETIQLSPGMVPIETTEFPWNHIGDPKGQPIVFQLTLQNNQATELADVIICNSFHEIESATFALCPNILPVGPLMAGQKFEKPVGHFWQEDMTCVSWLNEQPNNSVIYVAFGSFTIFDPVQFEELAYGLELTKQPFLWVVRPDFTDGSSNEWLEEFRNRVKGQGMIVSWSPQQQVLAHPSIACFISHCGWNSTMEGVRNGVPFLCWPYFTDQFLNQSYICNTWRIGFKLTPDEKGIISRERIKEKVGELLADEELKARAFLWKDIAHRSISEGGSSYENFKKLVNIISQDR